MKQRKAMTLIFVAVLTLAALPLSAAPKERSCFALVVGSQEKAKGSFDFRFSATEILDLDFTVLLNPSSAKNLQGSAVAEFRVYNPNGHLYQTISVPFSANPKLKGKDVTVPGYPMPLETVGVGNATVKNSKFLSVATRMPVAGTAIVHNGLYGDWRVEATVNDDSGVCSIETLFSIAQ